MKDQHQVIWSEIRDDEIDGSKEMFYVLAEESQNQWTFFERSSWELRWYPITPTLGLLDKALGETGSARAITNKRLHVKQVA